MLQLFLVRVAEWPPVWERAVHSVKCACLSCTFYRFVCFLFSLLVFRMGVGFDCIKTRSLSFHLFCLYSDIVIIISLFAVRTKIITLSKLIRPTQVPARLALLQVTCIMNSLKWQLLMLCYNAVTNDKAHIKQPGNLLWIQTLKYSFIFIILS